MCFSEKDNLGYVGFRVIIYGFYVLFVIKN